MSHTILVGYDDSDSSRRALDRAVEEARSRHARLLVLAVLELPIDPNAPRAFGTMGDGAPVSGPYPEPPEITDVLDAARAHLDGTGVPAEYHWAPGEPAGLILSVAAERKVDLVVVGHHHHGFLSRMFGGDVAAEVQRHSGSEVIVVDAH